MRKVLIVLLGVVGVLGLVIAITIAVVHEPEPTGETGPEADRMARRIIEWTKPDAWAKTGAVRWNFAGRFDHVWDRQRGFSKVSWGPYVVLLDLSTQEGVVRVDGELTSGDRAKDLIEKAYSRWTNDSFWLNPFDGVFDESTQRAIVDVPGRGKALLVTYKGGGLTPGDSYLWFADEAGQPSAWKMWVAIIPVGGLEVSWEDWIELSTGAKIATMHKGFIDLPMSGVEGAANIGALFKNQPDPFAELVGDSPKPSSRPAKSTETSTTSGAASLPAAASQPTP